MASIVLPKNGKPISLETAALRLAEAAQVREEGTDEEYAEDLAELLKAGKKLPRVKVMRVTQDGKVSDYVFDGMHTARAHQIAGKKVVQCVLFKGTYDDLLVAAGTLANREHEAAGRKLNRKDKRRAVLLVASAYRTKPVREQPSYLSIAKAVGVSHTFVSNIDPFNRAAEKGKDKPDAQLQQTESEDAQENDTTPTAVGPKPSANGKPASPADKGAKLFDWSGYESTMGTLARGLATMGETYDLKKSPEYIACYNMLDQFAGHFKKWREKHGGKK